MSSAPIDGESGAHYASEESFIPANFTPRLPAWLEGTQKLEVRSEWESVEEIRRRRLALINTMRSIPPVTECDECRDENIVTVEQ